MQYARYAEPIGVQLLLIGVAGILPLVWAFKHHGRTRMLTLIIWIPLWLFVVRVFYFYSSPGIPLEVRVRWALSALGADPLSLAWPLFVLLIYGLIWLFTMPRRRREANAQTAAAIRATPNGSIGARAQPAVPVSTLPPLWKEEKPAEPEPLKRCFGCNRRVPVSATNCPYCRYGFESSRSLEAATLPKAGPHTLPAEKRKTCPKCDMIVASWANHCPACQHSFAQVHPPASVVEVSGPPPEGPAPSGNAKPSTAVVEQIRLLGELRDEGLLTEDEFQTKKQELLSRL